MILSTNKTTDPNKFLPIRYPWARKCYKDESANHWVPESIPMGEDATQWKTGKLTEAEKQMVLMNVGFFSTAESLTANNIVLAAYRHVSDPACRQYMLRQAYTEAIHTDTFVYCCDTLGLNPDEVYDAYLKIESIKEKDDFVLDITKTIFDPSFQIHEDDPETIRKFLFDLIGFYVLMEGIFFYAGFCMMLGLKRRNLMVGLGEQFDYILRDECITPDTQLLTPDGWKYVTDITKEDKVLQWHEDGTTSFTHPTRLSKSTVDKVYRIHNRRGHVDQCVSENHRVPYFTEDGSVKVMSAKDITPAYHKAFPMTGMLRQEGRDTLTQEECDSIAQQEDFKDWVDFSDKSGEWCKAFINEVIKEKHRHEEEDIDYLLYASDVPENAQIVQTVATLAGYRTNYQQDGDTYHVWIQSNSSTIVGHALSKEEIPYDGYVYGVEVPSSYIVIKRNNAVSVTGNSIHMSFGNQLIHTIKHEYVNSWNKDFEERVIEAIRTAVRLEQVYAREACPPGISGMNANQICQYVEYIADRRLQRLGLPMLYNVSNPFPWMETSLDLQQRKNFFETKVTDYQTGTLEW